MSLNMQEMLLGRVRGLSHIRRYSSLPVIRPENVAEHGYYVAWYAWNIAMNMQARGHVVNMGDLLQKALQHDVEECATGDILRTFKYSTPELKESIDAGGERVVKTMAAALHGPNTLVARRWEQIWAESKDGLEGRIVAFCDFLSVMAYIIEEWECGNRGLCRSELPKMPRKLSSFLDVEPLAPVVQETLGLCRRKLKEYDLSELPPDGGAL